MPRSPRAVRRVVFSGSTGHRGLKGLRVITGLMGLSACLERPPRKTADDTGPSVSTTDFQLDERIENCTGGVDEDHDGWIDCADADCVGDETCVEDCTNGIDDDVDGLTDCADDDCAGVRACVEDCTNGDDDDADGLTDCADDDCDGAAVCIEDCTGGLDEDVDGLIDCADPDCSDHAGCPEDCTNGDDDDADALVDCADPECAHDVACPEDCSNGIDDDADGLADCDDPECSASMACPEDCSNGIDDDADGLADCDDPECGASTACPENCMNGMDDDGDGLVDCEDAECVGSAACSEACGDDLDNDLDGLVDCDDDECWPYCVDATVQVLGSSGGWSERLQYSAAGSSSWGRFDRNTSSWTNVFSMVSGTMVVERPSTSAVTSCVWTAHGVEFGGHRRYRWESYFSSSTSVSVNLPIVRSATTTSGACGIDVSLFLPRDLLVDRLAAGSSPSSVPFKAELRGGAFVDSWYRMGLPAPNLLGSSASSSSGRGSSFRRATHSWSSSAVLYPGDPIVIEDMVIP